MGWEAWLTLAVVAAVVMVLARDLATPSIAVLGGVVLLLVTGVVNPDQALAGFSNPAPFTVAALYIVAAAVEKTGALQPIVSAMLGRTRGGRRAMGRLLLPTAASSAFLNNTPIVAMMAPQVAAWAERRGTSASRYLMPLSFATILGGTVTLIGTSTNLLISGLLSSAGLRPLGMFELARIGLPVALAGIAYLILAADVLLPERRAAKEQAESELRAFTVNMRVESRGALDGATVLEGGLRHLQGVFLVALRRGEDVIAPVGPDARLRGGDVLTFAGKADLVVDLQRMRGLVSTELQHVLSFGAPGRTFFEAVVGEASPLVGRTLKEVEFRARYQAAVVAIHRSGQRVASKLGEVRLKVGDTLLLVADPGFRARWRDRSDFLLVSRLGGSPPMPTGRAAAVGIVALGAVLLAAFGVLSILEASLVGAVALVLSGILTAGEARAAIDLDVILVIAGSFGLGAALQASGLAAILGDGLATLGGRFGTVGALAGVVVATVVLTELITNNAAAAIMFPVAVAAAGHASVDPRAFAVAVAISASASFLTPIGYQTNTMVYGMGGYRFGDFARLGAGLTIMVATVVVVGIGIFGLY